MADYKWRLVNYRLPPHLIRKIKQESHARSVPGRRMSDNSLVVTLLIQSLGIDCHYCEPDDRDCPGPGICHCGCEQLTESAAKFVGDHHSRRVPLVGS